jgi:hypothetical protein
MEFTVNEREMAEQILAGEVTREKAAELRKKHLRPGKDWVRTARGVFLTVTAAEALRGMMAPGTELPASVLTTAAEAPTEPVRSRDAARPEMEFKVTRVYPLNPRYMEGTQGEHQIRIRVRSTINFVTGMALPAAEMRDAGNGLWDYVGRLPRARGRW